MTHLELGLAVGRDVLVNNGEEELAEIARANAREDGIAVDEHIIGSNARENKRDLPQT